jgi:hypothetical protein
MVIQAKAKLVAVVDDDELMRNAVQGLLKGSWIFVTSVRIGRGVPEFRLTFKVKCHSPADLPMLSSSPFPGHTTAVTL